MRERAFNAAVDSFRRGRSSEAYGRFLELALDGDADAARIVLFMRQYGPLLYGSYWDLGPAEQASLERLAAGSDTRKQPVFRPAWSHPVAAGGRPERR